MAIGGISHLIHGKVESFSNKINKVLSQFQIAVFSIFEALGRLLASCLSFKRKPDATLILLDKGDRSKASSSALKEVSEKLESAINDASTPLSRPDRPSAPAPLLKSSEPRHPSNQRTTAVSKAALHVMGGIAVFFGILASLHSHYSSPISAALPTVLKPVLPPVIDRLSKVSVSQIPSVVETVVEKVVGYCPTPGMSTALTISSQSASRGTAFMGVMGITCALVASIAVIYRGILQISTSGF